MRDSIDDDTGIKAEGLPDPKTLILVIPNARENLLLIRG